MYLHLLSIIFNIFVDETPSVELVHQFQMVINKMLTFFSRHFLGQKEALIGKKPKGKRRNLSGESSGPAASPPLLSFFWGCSAHYTLARLVGHKWKDGRKRSVGGQNKPISLIPSPLNEGLRHAGSK
jgi:hypothetical protein